MGVPSLVCRPNTSTPVMLLASSFLFLLLLRLFGMRDKRGLMRKRNCRPASSVRNTTVSAPGFLMQRYPCIMKVELDTQVKRMHTCKHVCMQARVHPCVCAGEQTKKRASESAPPSA